MLYYLTPTKHVIIARHILLKMYVNNIIFFKNNIIFLLNIIINGVSTSYATLQCIVVAH